ncbi:MAG: prefoldin subunit alpha [Candidatus Aenigmarchaeota archaeon]|nr:prefoldin subunit alpha [Candidatus Aenigmarchaeota archaeon]
MADKKELQEKALAYRILESRLEPMSKQRDLLLQRMAEIESTLESINELRRNKDEVLFPLGSTAYTFGKITSNKMIVEIGAGVALEKTPEEAAKILEERKNEVEDVIRKIQDQMVETANRLEILAPELESMVEGHENLEGG